MCAGRAILPGEVLNKALTLFSDLKLTPIIALVPNHVVLVAFSDTRTAHIAVRMPAETTISGPANGGVAISDPSHVMGANELVLKGPDPSQVRAVVGGRDVATDGTLRFPTPPTLEDVWECHVMSPSYFVSVFKPLGLYWESAGVIFEGDENGVDIWLRAGENEPYMRVMPGLDKSGWDVDELDAGKTPQLAREALDFALSPDGRVCRVGELRVRRATPARSYPGLFVLGEVVTGSQVLGP